MKRTIAIIALLVLGIAGRASAQNTVTACVKAENGQTRVVSATAPCLPSEARVQWNVAGPVGPAGPAGPKGEPGPGGPFRLLDANDQLVGVVLTASTYYPAVLKVLRNIDDRWVAFDVAYAGYSGGSQVHYTDTACTSADRYMRPLSPIDFFRYGTVMTETTGQRFLVYPGDDQVPAGTLLRAYRVSGMTAGACTVLTTPISGTALANFRGVEQQPLELQFPFRLSQQ